MPNILTNKKLVVTGASSGIGKQIVWHIAKNGGVPIMLARSKEKMQEIQQQLRKDLSISSFVYQVDLKQENELTQVLEQILLDHKQIHGLINNAGAGIFNYVADMEWEDVEHMFRLNVIALMRTSKYLLPHFIEHQEGHIVNIASQAAKIATPKSSVYSASKHAVLGFTNALRLELVAENIFVTSVNLGPVRTNFFDTADPNGTYQKSVERFLLDPDQVAKKIIKYLFTNKREINLPWWMEFGTKIYYLFPTMFELIFNKQFNKK